MGGQACVFYGAAEFSRDLDVLVLVEDEELDRLRAALAELNAEPVAVPALSADMLRRGDAVHFRCRRADVDGLRIDVMSSLRGVAPFEDLWARRATFDVVGESIHVLATADLVRAKKTQLDKDWPVIRRLVEQSYFSVREKPGKELVEFWLQEMRTPELLTEICGRFPEAAELVGKSRVPIAVALRGEPDEVARELEAEERMERRLDQEHWAPLKRELEQIRRSRRG
jgi:hypothetical protein